MQPAIRIWQAHFGHQQGSLISQQLRDAVALELAGVVNLVGLVEAQAILGAAFAPEGVPPPPPGSYLLALARDLPDGV